MEYCKRCVMPDTRPGIVFHGGICNPCLVAETREGIDWRKRFSELIDIVSRGKKKYDCAITVSGGKDSTVQVYYMAQRLGLNCLLLNVNNYSWTKVGWANLMNLSDTFGCDIISLTLNRKAARIMTRLAFEELGSPTWYWDRAVYAWPVRMCYELDIPLLVYGENVGWEYGGKAKETPWANEQINNEVVKQVEFDWWLEKDPRLSRNDFINLEFDPKWLTNLKMIYLSYFVKWSGYKHHVIAKNFGFQDIEHEWKRQGFVENYDQIDSEGYLVHPWLKWPKFGHARVTDICSLWIREGLISREEGVEYVRKNEGKLDQRALNDFLNWTGYTQAEFFEIVEKFYSRDIFKKVDGVWELKKPIS